jgi:hypothetical protein
VEVGEPIPNYIKKLDFHDDPFDLLIMKCGQRRTLSTIKPEQKG